ncbi:MAG: helical backbone metal receptor [Desulfobacterales bacterium]|nr:helical backbone metal receptor [Desulfobacterales bacterium]
MISQRFIFATLYLLGIGFLIPIQTVCSKEIPKRVVSLSPIITETIYLVGAQDHLIANTTYCNVPKAAQNKEKIGSVIQMNVEKIIRLNPDLVIASALSREKQLKILEKMSIKVIRAQNPKTFEQMCDMTLKLGTTLGRAHQTQNVVDKARLAATAILAQTTDLQKPSIFLQIGIKPLHSANKDMFINEYIRYAGGINIAEHEGTGVYSREKVVAMDPDVILVATMGTSKKAANLEKDKWMAHTAMKSVQHSRVHVLDPELICSPTPVTFVKGLQKILPLIHPEVKNSRSDSEDANAPQS